MHGLNLSSKNLQPDQILTDFGLCLLECSTSLSIADLVQKQYRFFSIIDLKTKERQIEDVVALVILQVSWCPILSSHGAVVSCLKPRRLHSSAAEPQIIHCNAPCLMPNGLSGLLRLTQLSHLDRMSNNQVFFLVLSHNSTDISVLNTDQGRVSWAYATNKWIILLTEGCDFWPHQVEWLTQSGIIHSLLFYWS